MAKCDNCTHKEVCKYTDEFKEFEAKQETASKPFGIETKCQHYRLDAFTKAYSTLHELQLQQTFGGTAKGIYTK